MLLFAALSKPSAPVWLLTLPCWTACVVLSCVTDVADCPLPRLSAIVIKRHYYYYYYYGVHFLSPMRTALPGWLSSVGCWCCVRVGCIEYMRRRLLLLMFAVSVCQSRMHRMTTHSEANLRLGFTVRGHSVQPLPNQFGLFVILLVALCWFYSVLNFNPRVSCWPLPRWKIHISCILLPNVEG